MAGDGGGVGGLFGPDGDDPPVGEIGCAHSTFRFGPTPVGVVAHSCQESSWRAQMSGRRVVYSSAADVYHDYDFERHGKKRYFMERNRIAFLGTCFSGRPLLLL